MIINYAIIWLIGFVMGMAVYSIFVVHMLEMHKLQVMYVNNYKDAHENLMKLREKICNR